VMGTSDLVSHRIERSCESPQLVVPSRGHALSEIARGDGFRSLRDTAERSCELPAAPPGDEERGRGAQHGEQHAFGEQLSHESRAPGADRQTDADLAAPPDGASGRVSDGER